MLEHFIQWLRCSINDIFVIEEKFYCFFRNCHKSRTIISAAIKTVGIDNHCYVTRQGGRNCFDFLFFKEIQRGFSVVGRKFFRWP